jgi:hypothetical protein
VEDLLGMLTDPDPLVNSLEPSSIMFPPPIPAPRRREGVRDHRSSLATRPCAGGVPHDVVSDLHLAVVDHLEVS